MRGVAESRVATLTQLLRLKGQRATLGKQFREASANRRVMSTEELKAFNTRFALLRDAIDRLESERAWFQRRA